jgi:hypothetical protein
MKPSQAAPHIWSTPGPVLIPQGSAYVRYLTRTRNG